MEDLSGQTLGPYRLLNRIGAGGMATVYRAYQPNMDRYVAVKVLPREFAQDPAFVGRFEQEARTIAKLEHRHILPVYDYGEDGGVTYLVMRYIDAGTLKDLIERGPVDAPAAAQLTAQVAEALGYAHRLGVIHRDVKPSNVLLDQGGDTYLTDFGIARLVEVVSRFTGSGQLLGTPSYMSPEQGQGQPVDHRSDIYSLGIVLYELVTGSPPFEAETPIAVVLMHIQDPLPPPRQFDPAIPEEIERIILKATAKSPDDRFQSADDMARALRDALNAAVTRAHAAPPGPSDVTEGMERLRQISRPETASVLEAPRAAPPPTTTGEAPAAPRRRRAPVLVGIVLVAAALAIAGLLVARRGGPSSEDATATAAQTTQVAEWAQTQEAATLTAQAPTATPAPTSTPVPFAFVAPSSWKQYTNTESVRDLVYHDGAVWAATSGGLVRWSPDGDYAKYMTAEGLPFTSLHTLIFDREGALWLARDGESGLARVFFDANGALASAEYVSRIDDHPLYVWDFLQTDDALLLSAYGPEFRAWTGATWERYLTPPEGFGEYPYAMAWVEGKLWVGMDKGLVIWDGATWSRADLPDVGADEPVYAIVADSSGGVWATTASRTLYRAPETGEWSVVGQDAEGNRVTAILESAGGRTWRAGPGYISASPQTPGGEWEVFADLPGWDRTALVEDEAGNVWVATNAGALRYDGVRWEQRLVPGEPLSHDLGQIIPAPDGRLWFPVRYAGNFVVYDPAAGAWTAGVELEATISVAAFSGEALWVGTAESGLIRLRGNAQRRFTMEDGLIDGHINALAVDSKDPAVLWIGTDAGVSRFDSAAGTWQNFSSEEADLADNAVTGLCADADGRIWAASGAKDYDSDERAALSVFDGERWTRVGAAGAPFDAEAHLIPAMTVDAAGNLWVGADQGGVYRWDGAAWRAFNETDGAPSYGVYAMITAPDGSLWLSADDDGLYHFHPDEGWSHLPLEAWGWHSDAYAMTLLPDGDLWLLTEEGVIRFSL